MEEQMEELIEIIHIDVVDPRLSCASTCTTRRSRRQWSACWIASMMAQCL